MRADKLAVATFWRTACALIPRKPQIFHLRYRSWRRQSAAKRGLGDGRLCCRRTTLQIVGEQLCESIDIRAGAKVLDVAGRQRNVSLAAARRWCDVVATDYVPSLLDRAATAEANTLLSSFARPTPRLFRFPMKPSMPSSQIWCDVYARSGTRSIRTDSHVQNMAARSVSCELEHRPASSGQLFKTIASTYRPRRVLARFGPGRHFWGKNGARKFAGEFIGESSGP